MTFWLRRWCCLSLREVAVLCSALQKTSGLWIVVGGREEESERRRELGGVFIDRIGPEGPGESLDLDKMWDFVVNK